MPQTALRGVATEQEAERKHRHGGVIMPDLNSLLEIVTGLVDTVLSLLGGLGV